MILELTNNQGFGIIILSISTDGEAPVSGFRCFCIVISRDSPPGDCWGRPLLSVDKSRDFFIYGLNIKINRR